MSLLVAATFVLIAHTAGLSGGTYVVDGGTLRGRLSFQAAELEALRAARGPELAAALGLELSLPGRVCSASSLRLRPEEPDGQQITFEARCEARAGEVLTIELGFLDHLPAGHRHFFEAKSGGASIDGVAYRGSAQLRLVVGESKVSSWLGWALPLWLLFAALGLGSGTRRHTLEVFVAASFASVMLVGVGAAADMRPTGRYIELGVPLFAIYLAAERYYLGSAPRRVALALPAGIMAAMLLLAKGLPVGAAEDRVVVGLIRVASIELAPGGLLLAISGLVSLRWPRATSVVVAALASVALIRALL